MRAEQRRIVCGLGCRRRRHTSTRSIRSTAGSSRCRTIKELIRQTFGTGVADLADRTPVATICGECAQSREADFDCSHEHAASGSVMADRARAK